MISQKQELKENYLIPRTNEFGEVIPAAEDVYMKSVGTGKKRFLTGLFSLIAIELGITGFVFYQIRTNDFDNRVRREFNNRVSGEIGLSTGTYTGETDFGYFFGEGDFQFVSGSKLTGVWENNALEGLGTLNVPVEGTYIGGFRNSKKEGEGTFTWDDGTVYTGEWHDDTMTGQGRYESMDGVIYTGTFENNIFSDGECVFDNETGDYHLVYKNGSIDNAKITYHDGTLYEGQCDVNGLSGLGEMKFTNGDVYNGSFENGIRNGNGTYHWSSGELYDGQWSNDMISGTGSYTFLNGSTLQGIFADNTFIDGNYHTANDFGDYTFTIKEKKPSAVVIVLADGTQYTGEMNEEGLNGKAQIKYSNGDSYDGNVLNGAKEGQGSYKWVSGASYEGSWENDVMSGRGTYNYPSDETGYKLVGSFKNGVPDGECDYYATTTEHYDTTWSDGKCVKVTE